MGRVPWFGLPRAASPTDPAMKWNFRMKLACAIVAGLLVTALLGKFWGVGVSLLVLTIPIRDR